MNNISVLEKLTKRERQIFLLLVDGLLSKQIAYELDVEETTVRTMISKIFRKLKVNSRSKAIGLFYKAFISKIANNEFDNPASAALSFIEDLRKETVRI